YRHWPTWINGEISQEWPLYAWVVARNMLTAYGDDHRRLRRLVSSAFTARRTAAMRPRIEAIAAELLDRLDAEPPGAVVDLRERYAYPLPIQVICELFGVHDAAARAEMRRCTDSFFHTSAGPEEVVHAYTRMQELLGELVAAKRETPGDDLSSALIAARDDDSRLSEQELIDTLMLMISAGHETTVNLLGNAVHMLLTHRDQLEMVRDGRASWNDVIEETLRAEGPIANIPIRFAVEDIPLDCGVTLRQGEPIIICLDAADHDPNVHGPDADRFDVTRADKEHMAFGHGVHYCLGAPLARLEASIALPALFDRFPDLALAAGPGEPAPQESFISNGRRTLPVRLKR
ncbi:MAG: cytochrome P450, partial [Actinomadura rubrobrunea]|nr:cytochrome P450 [Actinomadura rubrobrunea]